MNKIVLVLYVMKTRKHVEVVFDDRLCFIDNLFLLNDLYSVGNFKTIRILNSHHIFLKRDVPIKEFGFRQFEKLYIL